MRLANHLLVVRTPGRGLVEVTHAVQDWTAAQRIASGLLTLFCRHTSASLLIQENAAPAVRTDLEAYFVAIAPEDPGRYRHDEEGTDDMPSHLRAALTATSVSIPLVEGDLMLGPWQGIFLFEHRAAHHRREIALNLIGQ